MWAEDVIDADVKDRIPSERLGAVGRRTVGAQLEPSSAAATHLSVPVDFVPPSQSDRRQRFDPTPPQR